MTTVSWTTVISMLDYRRGQECVISPQTGCGAHPATYPMGAGRYFLRGRDESDRSFTLTTHLHLMPKLKINGFTSIRPYICIVWCLIKYRASILCTVDYISWPNIRGLKCVEIIESIHGLRALYASFVKAGMCYRCMLHEFPGALAVLMTPPCSRTYAVCSRCIIYRVLITYLDSASVTTKHPTSQLSSCNSVTWHQSTYCWRWVHILKLVLGRLLRFP